MGMGYRFPFSILTKVSSDHKEEAVAEKISAEERSFFMSIPGGGEAWVFPRMGEDAFYTKAKSVLQGNGIVFSRF